MPARTLVTEFPQDLQNDNSEVIAPFTPPLNSNELAVALGHESEELEESMPLVFVFRYTYMPHLFKTKKWNY